MTVTGFIWVGAVVLTIRIDGEGVRNRGGAGEIFVVFGRAPGEKT